MSIRDKKERIREGLTAENRRHLYAVAHELPSETAERIGMSFPCEIYAQDPFVAAADEAFEPREIHLRWEPGLADGPTSSRIAVVDYDAASGRLVPPARWDQRSFRFVRPDGEPIAADRDPRNPWFRQVNAWAVVQAVLELYEAPRALGRPIPWGFAGNRLIVVPHAGYQENAYYQRASKALHLYYYGNPADPSYTSLSHDILAHEAGHAVLDGIRPLYLEYTSRDTAAFHESLADLTALLVAFRHNHQEAHPSDAETIQPERLASWLSAIAEEFGDKTQGRPYLRNARNDLHVGDLRPSDGHHHCSQVLTGAMFDILTRVTAQYLSPERQARRKASVRQALWWAAERMRSLALQPLDLLPPADVRFVDYARAVLRNLEITDPDDPAGYHELARQVFHDRGLCDRPFDECDADTCPLSSRPLPRPEVFHDIDKLSRSATDAYHFLHDNRKTFEIPVHQDFEILDLYESRKHRSDRSRLPRQIVLQYLWREEVELADSAFGKLAGAKTTLPCGGTLVLDDGGNVLSWSSLPGRDSEAGRRRHLDLVERLTALSAGGSVGVVDDPATAALGAHLAPVLAKTVDGVVRFETAPHLCNLYSAEEEPPWTTAF
jgi:hypothetical protein